MCVDKPIRLYTPEGEPAATISCSILCAAATAGACRTVVAVSGFFC
eukprot:COSAG02_NODE_4883_length_4866_cov_2.190476_2_plen_46_part_00